jgi:hypothetical protein
MVMLGNQQEDAASCWLPSPCQSAGGLSEIEEYFMYYFSDHACCMWRELYNKLLDGRTVILLVCNWHFNDGKLGT